MAPDTHEPYALAYGGGKCVQNVYSWDKEPGESFITTRGLIERGYLLSNDGDYSIGGIASLKPGE